MVLLVLEGEGVVTAAAGAGAGTETADGRGCGQRERDGLVGVVDEAGNERTADITIDEADYYFLPNPRNEDGTETLARPALGDSDPTAALFISVAFTVPVELDTDTAVLVGPDLFAGFTDDECGLGAVYLWRCVGDR